MDNSFALVAEAENTAGGISNNRIRRIAIATGAVTTFAGNGTAGSEDGVGTLATFKVPRGVALSPDGVFALITDSHNARIRYIDMVSRSVTTLAGSTHGYADGTGTNAMFNGGLLGISIDPAGSYALVVEGNRIRHVDIASKLVTTLAGSGATGFRNGVGTNALFSGACGVAIDPTGAYALAVEWDNNRIRRVVIATAQVTTLAGNGVPSGANGAGAVASFYGIDAIAVASNGAFALVSEFWNNDVRRIELSSLCSAGAFCPAGSPAPVPCSAGAFCNESGLNAVSGNCSAGAYCPAGSTNQAGSGPCPAGLYCPSGQIAACTAGYFCSHVGLSIETRTGPCAMGAFCPAGSSAAMQQACAAGYFCNDTGLTAPFACQTGYFCRSGASAPIACPAGSFCPLIPLTAGANAIVSTIGDLATSVNAGPNAISSDTGSNSRFLYVSTGAASGIISRIDSATGAVAFVAGSASFVAGASVGGLVDLGCWNDNGNRALKGTGGTGCNANGCTVQQCSQIALAAGATIFGLQWYGHCFYRTGSDNFQQYGAAPLDCTEATGWVNRVYQISTFSDGIGSQAAFGDIGGMAADIEGYLYVADTSNNRLRRIRLETGAVVTVAGNGNASFSDGFGSMSSFSAPRGLAIDSANRMVFVSDSGNNRIRQISIASWSVSTLAGSNRSAYADGVGTQAAFNQPSGIALLPATGNTGGILFVADTNNNCIRRLEILSGAVTTLVGSSSAGFLDGVGSMAMFSKPFALAVDAYRESLFTLESGTNRIRAVILSTRYVQSVIANSAIDAPSLYVAFGGWTTPMAVKFCATSPGAAIECVAPEINVPVNYARYVTFPDDAKVSSSGFEMRFAAKTSNDIAVAFMTEKVQQSADAYEVVLGGWDNTKSVIRRGTQASSLVEQYGAVCSATEFRSFWVRLASGVMSVGSGDVIGANELMAANVPQLPAVGANVGSVLSGIAISSNAQGTMRLLLADSSKGKARAIDGLFVEMVPLPCELGSYCPPLSASMITCPAGHFCQTGGMSAPTVCVAGSFCNTTGLSRPSGQCAGGHYCAAGSTMPTQFECVSPHYCPIGSSSQTICPAGGYCPSHLMPLYISSPPGTYTNDTGLTFYTGNCTASTYCPLFASQPIVCPERAYCPVDRHAISVHHFSRKENCAGNLTECDAGAFCNATGLTAIAGRCEAGYYCPLGSRAAAERACGYGHFCPPASAAQVAAPVGSFCAATGMSAAAVCEAGFYCNATALSTAAMCRANHFSAAGQSECTPCPGALVSLPGSSMCHVCLADTCGVQLNLVAPQSIGACDALVLDASSSTGSVGAALVAHWSLVSWPTDTGTGTAVGAMTVEQLAAVRARLDAASTNGLLLVTVDASMLPSPAAGAADAVFVFALSLTNRYSYSASARVSVRKTSRATMPLMLSGPAFQTITRASPFVIQASTDYAATALCGNPIASLSVAFAWTQLVAGSPALAAFPNMTIGGTSLVGHALGAALPGLDIRAGAASLNVPIYVGTVGRSYVFQLTMTASVTLAGQSAADTASTSASALVALRIVAAPLVARIEGGNRQGMGTEGAPPMRLYARGSYDPDAVSDPTLAGIHLRYLWLCASNGTGALACPHLPAHPSPASFVDVSLAGLSSAALEFRVVVSSAAAADERQTTSAPVTVTRVLATLPLIRIQVSVPSQGGATYTTITPNDAVVLAATVSAQQATNATAASPPRLPGYQLAWSCLGCGLDMNMTAGGPASTNGALLTAPTLPTLVVRAGVMQPATAYTFVLAYTSRDPLSVSSSSASVTLTIGRVPGGGMCTAAQTAGVALQDTFLFRCQAWQDDQTNYPLSYQFSSFSINSTTGAETSAMVLQEFSPASTCLTYLAAGASMRVTVRNRFGGSNSTTIAMNVSSPDVTSLAAVTSSATTALAVLARSQASGDVNAASQAAAPLLQILNAAASTSAAGAALAIELRAQLFSASIGIASDSVAAAAASGSGRVGTLAQSVQLINSIVVAPAGQSINLAVATGGAAFAAQAAQGALTSGSNAPFSPALAGGLMDIASACLVATSINPAANATLTPQQRLAQRQTATAAAAAAESVSRGVLIGAAAGQRAVTIATAAIAITASRQAVDPLTGQLVSSGGIGHAMSLADATGSGSAVSAPPMLLAGIGASSDSVDAALVVFRSNPYAYADSGTQPSTSSPVVSFTVYDSASPAATPLPIANLAQPVLITVARGPLEANASAVAAAGGIACRFWSVPDAAWSTAGCTVAAQTDAAFVVCACTHLTAFNVRLALPVQPIARLPSASSSSSGALVWALVATVPLALLALCRYFGESAELKGEKLGPNGMNNGSDDMEKGQAIEMAHIQQCISPTPDMCADVEQSD